MIMNILKVQGDIDNVKLDAELLAALGAAGSPMKWWTVGEKGTHTVYYNDQVDVTAVQRVVDAHLAAAVKRNLNAPIEAQISTIELGAPITHRSLREGFIGGAQQSPAVNAVISGIEAKLNEIIAYLKSKDAQLVMADASVGRIPDITQAFAIKKLVQLDAAVTALRNSRS